MVRWKKRIEAEGLPIYMDKGRCLWIRPMKTTLKGRAVVFIIARSSVSSGNGNRVVIVEDFHTGQCSHGKCYAKNH